MISNLTMHEGDGDDYGYLYHDDSLYHDQWDWGGPLTPLPGFGFFPSRVAQELEHMTQVQQLLRIINCREKKCAEQQRLWL